MTKMELKHIEFLRYMIETSPRWADVAREELEQIRKEKAAQGIFFV